MNSSPRALVRHFAPAAVLMMLIAADPALADRRVYRYVDANGITHYSDKAPADDSPLKARTEVRTIRVPVDPQTFATFRLTPSGDAQQALVRNLIAGPVTVELQFSSADNVESDPPLPTRAVIAAGKEQLVAIVLQVDPQLSSKFEIKMRAQVGADGADHDDSVVYDLPFHGSDWRLDQGPNGVFSHTETQSRFAIDLTVPEGTPVLAAREGIVAMVEDDFEGAGLDSRFAERANLVRVIHDDGSMAVYAHLQAESALVRTGQRVRRGTTLARSGNTGYSTGPHLHFAVQVNRALELESIPFEMSNGRGGTLEL